jgi:hypothetical protein
MPTGMTSLKKWDVIPCIYQGPKTYCDWYYPVCRRLNKALTRAFLPRIHWQNVTR